MDVVAEGVETAEQLHLLKLLRCDQIQGFLFNRPLPFDEIEAMLVQISLEK
jgi:EAL domain-containing protein (putative c-di-GMP-specific phosphodiesterase class I)